jgi:hypothetical protein
MKEHRRTPRQRPDSRSVSKVYNTYPRRVHQIVVFLEDSSIVPTVQPEFLKPLRQMSEHAKTAALHPGQNFHETSFN